MASQNLRESFSYLRVLFNRIGCEHCHIFSEKEWYGATQKKQHLWYYSEQFSKKFNEGVQFESKVLDSQYGYIIVPGITTVGLSQYSLNALSQQMYDQILAINSDQIKGWIIDLRFNTGGGVYSMLTSLYHFLGSTIVFHGMDDRKKVLKIRRLDGGSFFSDDKLEVNIKPKNNPDITIPVALIIGNWTISAGEDIVISFKGRKNVLLIGESTYGFMTGNDVVSLPFGMTGALTTHYIADRNQNLYESLIPDISIKNGDNFDDLTQDKNIIEAIKFINSYY